MGRGSFASTLFETTCVGCGLPGAPFCSTCVDSLSPVGRVHPVPPGVDECLALWRFEGVGRDAITAIKYRNRRTCVGWICSGLAALAEPVLVDRSTVVVTWVPTTASRAAARGFDQARLLARGTARELGWPVRSLLRSGGPSHQTGASAESRWSRSRFVPRRSSRHAGIAETVVLVDDVCTTGSTMAAAATVLREVGALEVIGVVVAHTPHRRDTTQGGA